METIYMEVKCCLTLLQMIIVLKMKFLIKKLKSKLKNKKLIDMNKQGMFLEADLDYQKETHNLHKDFPLALERYNVTFNELSPINKFLVWPARLIEWVGSEGGRVPLRQK